MNTKKFKFLVEDMDLFFPLAMEAQLQHSMGGIGGCKHFEAEAFPAKFRKYLVDYVETEKSANECFAEYMRDNGFLST
jgi:hypothetical protein